MQPRILDQYIETIKYYGKAIKKNMTEDSISRDVAEQLNTLLNRLGNVSAHIGLEGGGSSSQEQVNAEDEALYSESSSEKFKFLGHLLALTKDSDLHIALVAKPGHFLDIIEMYLKGKKIPYSRPDTLSRSDPSIAKGRVEVSVIPSGEEGAETLPRSADLVVALDETFNARDSQVRDLRKHMTIADRLAPVIRLVIYASVEHFDLCLPRSLEPIDRLRKLIFCMWETQRYVGHLEPSEPVASVCAEGVAAFLKAGAQETFWTLPSIRPIENIPIMDSDSTLSDAMSDISDEFKPEGPPRYWPNPVPPKVGLPGNPILPGGKRPLVSLLIFYNFSYLD